MAKGTTQTDALIWGNSLRRASREALFWILGALALMMIVSLLTYSPEDPSFTHTGVDLHIQNAMGPVGAWLSDLLFFAFGRAAFLFPVMLILATIYLRRIRQDEVGASLWAIHISGFVLTLAASTALATLHFAAHGLPHGAGGALGGWLGPAAEHAFSFLGGTVLWLALWLAGLSLFIGVSWIAILEGVGRFCCLSYDYGLYRWARLKRWASKRKEYRKQEARSEPVIHNTQAELKADPADNKVHIGSQSVRPQPSDRVQRERQTVLFASNSDGDIPPLALLDEPDDDTQGYSDEALTAMSRQVELKLKDFSVDVNVVAVYPGPVVTRFELKPAPGFKVSKLTALSKDIARSLSVTSVRVVEIIPGKSTIGLEIPNEARELVTLSEVVRSEAYEKMNSPLTLVLGRDVSGEAMVADLAKMPHLMIAGTTGSGKSVALNAMVLSLLYKATPEEVRLIMIDPKMLELSVYEGIPHLLAPVVTDMQQAGNALRWAVAEMERRYKVMSMMGVRNLKGFNKKIREAEEAGEPIADPTFKPEESIEQEPPFLQALPMIVVVVDELADMMMLVGKKVEELIARLAQKARASGIHLILATQRPSVDVITGLIKANIPARIAFQVSSRIDSRTILDQAGAESLLGHGDMLFLPPGTSIPTRVHGAFVSDNEVHEVVNYLRESGEPQYIEGVLVGPSEAIPGISDEPTAIDDPESDPLYDQAVMMVTESRKASISSLQRRLRIGYNRSARLVEAMESSGIVSAAGNSGQRDVLAPPPAK